MSRNDPFVRLGYRYGQIPAGRWYAAGAATVDDLPLNASGGKFTDPLPSDWIQVAADMPAQLDCHPGWRLNFPELLPGIAVFYERDFQAIAYDCPAEGLRMFAPKATLLPLGWQPPSWRPSGTVLELETPAQGTAFQVFVTGVGSSAGRIRHDQPR
jgi:hypothetical protein